LRSKQQRGGHCRARRICEIAIINCASKAFIEKHGTARRLHYLKNHRAVASSPQSSGKPEPWRYIGAKGELSIMVPHIAAVDNAEMLIACTLAGLGIAQVWELALQSP
jgi:LysR family transcriptional regulator, regulator for bpeEF and oprC